MNSFSNESGRPILLSMVHAIQENKAYLGDVDGLIGDGDHGMNMNKGFTIYAEELGDNEISFSDGLSDLGLVLLNKIGGSMGPIYGTVFMEMADAADGAEEITLPLFTNMVEAGLEGLYGIVDARPGDKTLVDTLAPALNALKTAQKHEKSFKEALIDMKEASTNGMKSTVEMVAKYGRASRLGERSRGVQDAGATSCSIIFNAIADGIINLL